ncbi:unnamed protein product [Victoria cruziana]
MPSNPPPLQLLTSLEISLWRTPAAQHACISFPNIMRKPGTPLGPSEVPLPLATLLPSLHRAHPHRHPHQMPLLCTMLHPCWRPASSSKASSPWMIRPWTEEYHRIG